jgi:hypothetical protein
MLKYDEDILPTLKAINSNPNESTQNRIWAYISNTLESKNNKSFSTFITPYLKPALVGLSLFLIITTAGITQYTHLKNIEALDAELNSQLSDYFITYETF